jgi:hypothetical protein
MYKLSAKKQPGIYDMPHLFNGHVCVETFIVQVEHISGYLADTRPYKRSVELFIPSPTPFSPPLFPHFIPLSLLFILYVHPFSPLTRTANNPLYPTSLIV